MIKNIKYKIYILLALFILFFVAVSFILLKSNQISDEYISLEDILQDGEIIFITRNNAYCYYNYKDHSVGFEYDLAKAFAKYIGVNLVLKIDEKWESMIPTLLEGQGSVIAANMTCTAERLKKIAFAESYMKVKQHIIVQNSNKKIKYKKDLEGQTVTVRKGTSYEERLRELVSFGMKINIITQEDISTENLIHKVANREIKITIADSNIANLCRQYFPDITIAGSITGKEGVGWAVHPRAEKLLEKINSFFIFIKKNGVYNKIYQRYYALTNTFDYVSLMRFHRAMVDKFPKYSSIIKKASKKYGLDWRLITAQIYQESHFNPNAKSYADACGLMQLVQNTANKTGIKDIFNPEQNINGGVSHLKDLFELYDKAKNHNRIYIAIAAYNVGQGHIYDARNIARDMGLDPNKWKSLAKTLPLLQEEKYYSKATYGYCRGTEPVKYVKHIIAYYDILKYKSIKAKKTKAVEKYKENIILL